MRKFVIITTVAVLVGCAGTNWKGRVGTYSIDDAKREYGPANSCEHLNNDVTVCSWTTSIGRNWIDKLILSFDKDSHLISGGEKRF